MRPLRVPLSVECDTVGQVPVGGHGHEADTKGRCGVKLAHHMHRQLLLFVTLQLPENKSGKLFQNYALIFLSCMYLLRGIKSSFHQIIFHTKFSFFFWRCD